MAQEKSPPDQMHYEALAQDALRGVVKAALRRAASPEGIPGAHHFYITFRTKAQGVSGPPEVLASYPDEMTIVLQHQYWDLAPGETFFSITLKFAGRPENLSVPYAAITRFYDPSVQFLLQFEVAVEDRPDTAPVALPVAAAKKGVSADAGTSEDGDGDADGEGSDGEAKVVSLDQFRKK